MVGKPHPRHQPEHGIEDTGKQSLAQWVTALLLPAADQVQPISGQHFEQPRDLRRVVLQIRVQGGDVTSSGLREPRSQRRRLAEVASEVDGAHRRILGSDPTQHVTPAVGGAVVDEENLVVRDVDQRSLQLFMEKKQRRLLVVERNDNA